MSVFVKQGELVAIPAYFPRQQYPAHVVVAIVKSIKGPNLFSVGKQGVALLEPYERDMEGVSPFPLAHLDEGRASYFTKTCTGHDVWLENGYSRGEVYRGIDAISEFLARFDEYQPHLAALLAIERIRELHAQQRAGDESRLSAAL